MSVLSDVAEAIRDQLETGLTLSQKFTAYRSYGDWEDVLEDVTGQSSLSGQLRIDVVPQACMSRMMTRGRLLYECNVAILLRKKLLAPDRKGGRIDNGVIDQCVEDLQTVNEYFSQCQPNQTGRRLAALPEANWLAESTINVDSATARSTIRAPFSREMLKRGQYSGWATVLYGVSRAYDHVV